MQIDINGRQFRYSFHHERRYRSENPKRHGRATCRIEEVQRDIECERHVGLLKDAPCTCRVILRIYGFAYLSPKDRNYEREKGRSVSIDDALLNLFPNDDGARADFRRAYDQRPREPKKPKPPRLKAVHQRPAGEREAGS